ncbi:MAG: RNA degradosome polyphosphate kinase [Thiovulaceae bacterium]|nr:RNA degradosome polyphosphate kinase [Sulfurimonadaceae bacterium]
MSTTNLKDATLYINRELSWLQFNTRVLLQAQDNSRPPLERLKFLAIYATNLDEFYMIRVAGLKRLFKEGVVLSGPDQLTPKEQLGDIRRYLYREKHTVEKCFNDIVKALEKEGVFFREYDEVTVEQQKKLKQYFFDNLYSVIIPIAVDGTHPFPHLNNLSFGLIVKLADLENEDTTRYGLIRIPRSLPRFIEVTPTLFVPIESVVSYNVRELFPGYKMLKSAAFRVTRNADITIQEEEADDFMEILEAGLRLRRRGEMVRLELGKRTDDDLFDFFNSHTNIDKSDVYHSTTILNLGGLWQIVGSKDLAHLANPPFKSQNLPPFDTAGDIFEVIRKKEAVLFHPYESFDPIVKLIQNASTDPDVLAIRMTLYRAGSNSPIVRALVHASESGKQVTVMVELKARFDEENNVIWAKALEKAGAHVIYGISGLKVHAKLALVIRKEGDTLMHYAHIGTGNYNPATAKIYTDISILTTQEETTKDVTKFFHFLTGFSKKGKLDTLFMAPLQIKPKLLSLIQNEAKEGRKGHIIVKINSLVDEDMIKAFYKASQEGVKIDLIVRGICCLRPGIKGVSETITVHSIIGKYLEHSRIFYFKNTQPQIYISSADLMPRNLTRRIELMTPVHNEESAHKIFQILQLQVSDTVLSHKLESDGSYTVVKSPKGVNINNQKLLETHVTKVHNAIKKHTPNYVQQLANRLFKES